MTSHDHNPDPAWAAIEVAPHESQDEALLIHARSALQHAYCPYSSFRVGAAVRTSGGEVFTGANVENASYGLTVCAERVALWTAIAAGHRRMIALALTTEQSPAVPAETMPCGACRQVMAELLSAEARIVVDRVGTLSLHALLPLAFRLS